MNKKLIIGIIIGGILFGSIGVYAGSKMLASDVSVNAPTNSSLGSGATLQDSLDELYSIADKYDELNKKIDSANNWELIGQGVANSSSYATVKNLTPKLKNSVLFLVNVSGNKFTFEIPASYLKNTSDLMIFRFGNEAANLQIGWYRDINNGQAQLITCYIDGIEYNTSNVDLNAYTS